jgi:hypothetical protein
MTLPEINPATIHIQQLQNHLLNKLCLKSFFLETRLLMDVLLSRCKPSKQKQQQYENWVGEVGESRLIMLHGTAHGSNDFIVWFSLEGL